MVLEDLLTAWQADIESAPVAPIVCVVVGCDLPMVAMVYQWRPHGLSVYEPRCRDHQGGGS